MKTLIILITMTIVFTTIKAEKLILVPELLQVTKRPHYENPFKYGNQVPHCIYDEKFSGFIQGINGFGCFPGASKELTCPTDVPSGTTATPYPLVKDENQGHWCILICSGLYNGSCPESAECMSLPIETFGINLQVLPGVCLYKKTHTNLSLIEE